MPFNINTNEMSEQFAGRSLLQKKVNPIMEVITIDDDDEEGDKSYDINGDETDDIEILEIISNEENKDKREETITSMTSSQYSEQIEMTTDLTKNQIFDENDNKSANNSCDNCFKTIAELKDNLMAQNNVVSEAVVDSTDNKQNDVKSPKRIKPISLPMTASTSVAVHQSPDSSSDPPPNKLRRLSDPVDTPILKLRGAPKEQITQTESMEEPTPSTSHPTVDFETLFTNYIKTFKERMTAFKANESEVQSSAQKLEDIYLKLKNNNQTFLTTVQFSKLLETFTKEEAEMGSAEDVVRHHNDLMLELHRFSQKPDKKSAQKVKGRSKKIKDLTDAIKKVQAKIYDAENEEIDLEDMENETVFTDLPKLYQKAHELWAKREELLKRSTLNGRVMYKKFKCDFTPFPEINKCVETLFNNNLKKLKNKKNKGYVDDSFTFIDVRKAILDVITEKELPVMDSESMIKNIYEKLIYEKRSRRIKDQDEAFDTLETYADLKPETFVKEEDDPLIELQLVKNKVCCQQKLEAIVLKYSQKDRQQNGEHCLRDGCNEWDTDLTPNNEEFESLDVNEGELEEEVNSDDDSEDNELTAAPLPDFSAIEEPTLTTAEPIKTEEDFVANGDSDSSDDIIILS